MAIPVEGTPSEPRGLSATAGDQRVTLRWSAPSSDGGSAITRYEYRYRESGGSYGEWTTVSGGASATSRTVTGLDNGTTYEFQVRARNAIGPGPESSEARATLDESAPGAPARLTATGGDESVALSWSAPEDGGSQILRYEYRYGATGETWGEWMTVSGSGSARRVAVSGLTNGTLYAFQVRAVNSIGEGEAAQATATPGRAPSAPTGLAASVESESITVMWGMPADDGGSAIVRYEVNYRESGGQCERLDDGGRRRECHQPHHDRPDQRDRPRNPGAGGQRSRQWRCRHSRGHAHGGHQLRPLCQRRSG